MLRWRALIWLASLQGFYRTTFTPLCMLAFVCSPGTCKSSKKGRPKRSTKVRFNFHQREWFIKEGCLSIFVLFVTQGHTRYLCTPETRDVRYFLIYFDFFQVAIPLITSSSRLNKQRRCKQVTSFSWFGVWSISALERKYNGSMESPQDSVVL